MNILCVRISYTDAAGLSYVIITASWPRWLMLFCFVFILLFHALPTKQNCVEEWSWCMATKTQRRRSNEEHFRVVYTSIIHPHERDITNEWNRFTFTHSLRLKTLNFRFLFVTIYSEIASIITLCAKFRPSNAISHQQHHIAHKFEWEWWEKLMWKNFPDQNNTAADDDEEK